MKVYNVSEQQYGWIFGLVAAGLIASSQVNNLLLRKYSSAQIIRTVLLVQSLLGIILCLGSAFNWLNLFSTIGLVFLFLSCQGFSFPNSAALSLAPFTKEAGSASSLMGAFQMGFGAFASAFVGLVNNGTTLPMTTVMAGCGVLGLIILLLGRKRIGYVSNVEEVNKHAFEQLERY